MIMPDYPIENKDEDKLRRSPLAKKVAELIASFEGKESFVIGIEGVWGSGKTSFVNFVQKELKEDDDIIFVNFNPWNFSGQNELITDFFSTLIKKVEPYLSDKNKIRKAKSIISKFTKKSEIAISPEVTAFWGAVNFKANDLFKVTGDEKTLEEERKDVDDLFLELKKKVVIVIDDIDRLDTDETRLVMKLVKMTANFPNTVFVLCYDRQRVAEKLDMQGAGEEYLKKIIQVSFTLPSPDKQGLQKILFSDLDATLEKVYGKETNLEGNDAKRWEELQFGGFRDLFVTIRDIKRYISSLRLNWSIVGKEEVNRIDFIAVEAIRVFAPSLYSAISANSHVFTGTHNLYASFTGNDKKDRQAKFKELINELPKELQKIMESICNVLFPQLDNANYGGDWEQIWKQERRICVDERFGFYFQLGIPEGAISEQEANTLATTFNNKSAFSEKLLELTKDNRLRQMLIKVLDRVDTFTETEVKIVISSLWDLEKEIADERSAIFDFDDIETQTGRITYHAIKKLPLEKRFEIIEELVKTTKTFYPATRFVSMLVDQQNKQPQSGDVLLTKEETEKLRLLTVEKINTLASSDKLEKEKKLIFALYRWKDWEGEEKIKLYIKKLISTQEGLLIFLKGFVGKVLSTNGDYYQLDKKAIEHLYPISEIETLVSNIKEDELKLLAEEDKKSLDLFKKPPERDW